jgi:hypothetical protein
MKWFLIAAGVVLIAAFAFWQRGSVKSAYVNGLPQYSALPNREFILQKDCYIFKLKDRNTDFPLIADHALVPSLPETVDVKNVGADLPAVRILGVAQTGSILRLVSVRRDESRQGTSVTFEILFLDEATREYPRLDAFFVLDHSPEAKGAPPVFLDRYFVDRKR